MGKTLARLRSVDFYRKIPTDLTEATLAGASISLIAAVFIVMLIILEFGAFIRTETKSELVVDRSVQGELLRINFDISFPALSCEFATLDVSDALGTKRLNLTKTVRKLPINEELQRKGYYMHDDKPADIKYDTDEDHQAMLEDDNINWSTPLDAKEFKNVLDQHSIAVINFYAPWCPWCQRLEPTWEAVTTDVHGRYPETDGRIRFGKVDCTVEVELCREHHISGFPSIRVYRKGSDDITIHGIHEHEAYRGDRTKESLLQFAEALIPSAGQPHRYVRGVTRIAKTSGCNLSGFVLVKKVPGTMHLLAKSSGHSFDFHTMNMSHIINHMFFGNKPSPRRKEALAKLHPLGLTDNWADKMVGGRFWSVNQQVTHEHYLNVVLTTIEPRSRSIGTYDAYEYTVHSHAYTSDDIPSARFSYNMSPIQIVVTEQGKKWYHFVTTLCAIVGGVFTVAGIIDGMAHTGYRLAKKMELGKQT